MDTYGDNVSSTNCVALRVFRLFRFATQFFYSQEIFDRIIAGGDDASLIGLYVRDWMNAYLAVQQANPVLPNAECMQLANLTIVPGFGNSVQLCSFVAAYDFSWANFIEKMLNETALPLETLILSRQRRLPATAWRLWLTLICLCK